MNLRQSHANDAVKLIIDQSSIIFDYMIEIIEIIKKNPPKILNAKTKEEAVENFKAIEQARVSKMESEEEKHQDILKKQSVWGAEWPENEYQFHANEWQNAYDLWVKETPYANWAERITNYVNKQSGRLFNQLNGGTAQLSELESKINDLLSKKLLLEKHEKQLATFMAACQETSNLDTLITNLIIITNKIVNYYFEPLQETTGWKKLIEIYFPAPHEKTSAADRELYKKNKKAFKYLFITALLSQLNAVLSQKNPLFTGQTIELAANLIYKKTLNELPKYIHGLSMIKKSTEHSTSLHPSINDNPIKECKDFVLRNIKSTISAVFHAETFHHIANDQLETHFQKCINARNLGLHKKYIHSQAEAVMPDLLSAIKTAFIGATKNKKTLASCIAKYILTLDYKTASIDVQKAYKELILAMQKNLPTHFYRVGSEKYTDLIKWAEQTPTVVITKSVSEPLPVPCRHKTDDSESFDSISSVSFSEQVITLGKKEVASAPLLLTIHEEEMIEPEKEPLTAENITDASKKTGDVKRKKELSTFSISSLTTNSDSAIPSDDSLANLVAKNPSISDSLSNKKKDKKNNNATRDTALEKKRIVKMPSGIYRKPLVASIPLLPNLSTLQTVDSKVDCQAHTPAQSDDLSNPYCLKKVSSAGELGLKRGNTVNNFSNHLQVTKVVIATKSQIGPEARKSLIKPKLTRKNASLDLRTHSLLSATPRVPEAVLDTPRPSEFVTQGNNLFYHPPVPTHSSAITLSKSQAISDTVKKGERPKSNVISSRHSSLSLFVPANTIMPNSNASKEQDKAEKTKKSTDNAIKKPDSAAYLLPNK